jgi:hypothetical protein
MTDAMTDLRQLLELGAGEPPAALGLDAVQQRGRALVRRRRTLVTAVIAAAVAVSTAAVPGLMPDQPRPARPGLPRVVPGVLVPGGYADPTLDPKITFMIPESTAAWRVALATAASLVVTNDELGIRISVQHWSAVYPAPSAALPRPGPAAVPADLPGWLAGHPAVRVSRPVQRVLFLGRAAQRVTFDVRPDRRLPTGGAVGCSAPAECLTLAETSDNPVVVRADQSAQVTVVDGQPSGLVVTVLVPAGGTDDASIAEAYRIVNSITAIG